ncbi:Uncharacterised protein [Mycobacteroides abscessus subsp. abscessus]|nr:Uncharacterised protein [Mycobacteroides abscessus subsp. abscessus]
MSSRSGSVRARPSSSTEIRSSMDVDGRQAGAPWDGSVEVMSSSIQVFSERGISTQPEKDRADTAQGPRNVRGPCAECVRST